MRILDLCTRTYVVSFRSGSFEFLVSHQVDPASHRQSNSCSLPGGLTLVPDKGGQSRTRETEFIYFIDKHQ
jgi:hypothetical protein